ncbi:MAG: arginase [Pseudomonadota bacterium]
MHVQKNGRLAPTGVNLLFPQVRDKRDITGIVAAFCNRLSDVVANALMEGHFPIIIGGDHSCAIGTWAGVHHVFDGPLGMIWVDAHMDSHIPETSPSGALHGMPLAALLGLGDGALTQINGETPTLNPQNVCLYGVRSYEAGEAAILQNLGVRVITMEEINDVGHKATWNLALSIAKQHTVGYGISIDLDAVDPKDAPGVGSPEPGGLPGRWLAELLFSVKCDSELIALEIAEFNPYLDRNNQTLGVIDDIISAVLDQEICYARHHQA